MKKVHIVPHSHWDREWYFNIEDSNILLGENLTHLIDFLENNKDYPSYTFDAQGSIIEEYINIYPENKSRLKKLIEDKRIFVGPWYTQTDSLLVNKESIIRNLQYGMDTCNEYGYSMKIGYLPDIFGQNQYLPSIFKGFGIDDAILQRGIYTDRLKNNLNFEWESPDGKKIRGNNIYLGYGPGKFLDSSDEYIKDKLLPMLEKLKELNKDSNHLLLPAGGDQVLIREHFKDVVRDLNQKDLGYEFVLSDYESFMKAAWTTDAGNEKVYGNTLSGELRDTEKSRIHRTIGSSRYDIKEANSRVENKILKILEPLAIIGMKLGLEYPGRWLDISWKLLFDVHAHDSIGGCNSDTTNSDVLTRLEKVERIVDTHINLIKKKIVSGVAKSLGNKEIVTLFNTEVRDKIGSKVIIFTQNNNPIIKKSDGNIVESEILESEYISGGKRVVVTADGDVEEEIPGYYKTYINLPKIILPSLGYVTLVVEDKKVKIEEKISKRGSIENELYRIDLSNSKLTLINKVTGDVVEDFISFETTEDRGDSYDYSPAKGDKPLLFNNFQLVSTKRLDTVDEIILETKIKTPRYYNIRTIVRLDKNSNVIKVSHDLDNKEENQRLRVVVKSNVEDTGYSYSDSGFSLIKHYNLEKRMDIWKESKYAEAPVPIYNLENLVTLKDNKNQIIIYCEGIKEYEVANNNLNLTLFRSTGLLGRDNLMWRPGRASGINNKVVTTPNANLKKKLEFNYGIFIGKKMDNTDIYRGLDNYLTKDVSYQLQNLNTFEERVERFEIPLPLKETPGTLSLLKLENRNLFVSCIKKEHRGEGIIVRIYNPGDKEERVNFPYEVSEVRLDEIVLNKGNLFNIESRGYKTFRLYRGDL